LIGLGSAGTNIVESFLKNHKTMELLENDLTRMSLLAIDIADPEIRSLLETDEKMLERTLFGTDFYVVTKASSERKIAINARAYLGNELFRQIATINPVEFLSNKLTIVPA